MLKKREYIYEAFGSSFNVLDISEPINICVSPHDTMLTAWEALMESENKDWICIVRDESKINGYITIDEYPENYSETHCAECMTIITPDMIVPASMSIIELITLLENYPFFFVLEGNTITHVVNFYDLDKLPVKLCIFSFIMELEAKLIDIILEGSALEKIPTILPPKRLEQAIALCKDKKKEVNNRNLLLCTTFIDKKTIVRKDDEAFNKLKFANKNELDSFFKRIEDIRNSIAHSDSILKTLKRPSDFISFITKMYEIME